MLLLLTSIIVNVQNKKFMTIIKWLKNMTGFITFIGLLFLVIILKK